MSHTKANQLRCSLQLCLVTYMLKAIVGETRHTKPTKPRNPRHHMQNRAFSNSQQFCKAISIYSRSSQDVGLEVFDVLTIFFLPLLIPNILFCLAATASLILFPKWVKFYYLFKFLEMSHLLGASYLTFYEYNISDSARKMFSYYQRKGLAQVRPWNLSTYITVQDVHYHGQSFSMQDCMFRSINRLNVVAFNDLVEFIIPLQNESMPSLPYSIHDSNY